jgi:hypothetical protein
MRMIVGGKNAREDLQGRKKPASLAVAGEIQFKESWRRQV